MTKRAAIYTRVSTDEQANSGYSLPTQVEACKRYADAHGFEVVGVYQDDISGVTPIANRPDGGRLQALLNLRGADAVIVYRTDRLYRDNVEMLITARQWLQAGIELHFCDMGQVGNTNNLLFAIQSAIGSEERLKIKERLKRGKDGKAKSGRVISHVVTPYGYDFVEGELIPNQDAATVKTIFAWYTTGDGDGGPLTLNAICKRLGAMGVKTPGAGVYARKGPDTAWNSATLNLILSRTAYKGVWTWGKTRMREDKTRDHNPDEPIIEVPVPALVSAAVWSAAQERKEYNKKHARRNRQYNYLLAGRVTCGECGRSMHGHGRRRECGTQYRAYACSCSRNVELDLNGNRRCRLSEVQCHVLDAIAWEYAQAILTRRDDYEANLREAQRQEQDALQPKKERLAYVLTLLEQADREAREIKRALKDARGRVGELLQHDQDEVNARYEALFQEHQALETEIEAGALSDEQIAAMLAEYDENITTGMENATDEDKQRTFENLRLTVTVNPDKTATVSCRLPVPARVYCIKSTS